MESMSYFGIVDPIVTNDHALQKNLPLFLISSWYRVWFGATRKIFMFIFEFGSKRNYPLSSTKSIPFVSFTMLSVPSAHLPWSVADRRRTVYPGICTSLTTDCCCISFGATIQFSPPRMDLVTSGFLFEPEIAVGWKAKFFPFHFIREKLSSTP